MRVRFVTRAVYDTLGPGKGPVYEKGSVHDLEHHEAERWFRRNMAVPEPEPQAAPQAAPQKSGGQNQVVRRHHQFKTHGHF